MFNFILGLWAISSLKLGYQTVLGSVLWSVIKANQTLVDKFCATLVLKYLAGQINFRSKILWLG